MDNIAARKAGRDRLGGTVTIPRRLLRLPCFGYFSPITSNRGGASSNASGDISDRYQKGEGVVSRRVCRKLNYNFEINICLVG